MSLFNANHVKYLVIGGYAVLRYTEPRYTKDIDLWIATDAANAAAVFASLRQFGAPLAGIPVIRGTRLAVSFILNLLAHGSTPKEILHEYDGVTIEDIQACLLYATKVFDERGTYTSPKTYVLARRAHALYDESIRVKVETEENIGKRVVIDPETGTFAVDEKGIDASHHLHALRPGAPLYGMWIGYNVAVSFGGSMYRTDANAPPRRDPFVEIGEQIRKREDGSLSERLLAIGRRAAPRFKEPFDSTQIGDLLYDDDGLPTLARRVPCLLSRPGLASEKARRRIVMECAPQNKGVAVYLSEPITG